MSHQLRPLTCVQCTKIVSNNSSALLILYHKKIKLKCTSYEIAINKISREDKGSNKIQVQNASSLEKGNRETPETDASPSLMRLQ